MDKKKYIRYIINFVSKYPYLYILVVILVIAQSAMSLLIPSITMKIIDEALLKGNKPYFISLVFLLVGANIVSATFSFFRNYTTTLFEENVAKDIRKQLFVKIPALKYESYEKSSIGDITSLYNKAVNYIKEHICHTMIDMIIQFVKFVVLLIIMASINLKITFILLIVLALYMINYRFWGARIPESSKRDIKYNGDVLKKVNENHKNVIITKIYNATSYLSESYDTVYKKYWSNAIKLDRQYSANITLSTFILFISSGVVWFIGGEEVINGSMTIGKITALISYQSMLIAPMRSFSNFNNSHNRFKSAVDEVDKFLVRPEESFGKLTFQTTINEVRLKNVCFSYYNSGPILSNTSLVFRKNEIIGLVGLSGSGKSTVAKLLMGLELQKSGDIIINNRKLHEYDIEALRKEISYVSQSSMFYEDTLSSNLSIAGDTSNEDAQMMKEALDIDMIVKGLDCGWNGMLVNGGENMSEGEKKRLDILRAVLKDSSLIIFDESSAPLDKLRREALYKVIEVLKKDKIILWISHNLEEVNMFDRVYVFEDGQAHDMNKFEGSSAYTKIVKKEFASVN